MVSNILNLHSRVLSLSEFFSYVGVQQLFRYARPSGDWMWKLYSRPRTRTRHMVSGRYEELLYPLDDPGSRFSGRDIPPIMCATLPHLTDRYEELFGELEGVVRGQPKQPADEHLRYLFGWLCERFGADIWVERSGASLSFASRLLQTFPEARVIHVYRDGRNTAISMSRHHLFRLVVATIDTLSRYGMDTMEMLGKKSWDRISPWFEPMISTCLTPERLHYEKLTLEDYGAFWTGMIEIEVALLKDFPPDRLLNLKFEDMQAAPEAEIRRLIRFIDPSLEDEDWVREASAIPRQTPSKFAQLDPREQAALTEACRPGLELLGYPV